MAGVLTLNKGKQESSISRLLESNIQGADMGVGQKGTSPRVSFDNENVT